MVGLSKKTLKRVEWIKDKLNLGWDRWKTEEEFKKTFGLKAKSFYNLYVFVTRGKVRNDRGKSRIINKELNTREECYFCCEKETQQHHISYRPQIIVWLCQKCHNRVHSIMMEYHTSYTLKDDYIQQLENVVNSVRLCVSENAEKAFLKRCKK